MKKKSLLIGLLVVAMSGAAFAQHTPVPDLESCPATVDVYGNPVNWTFAPLPQFNAYVVGSPVNFATVEGQVDFCAYTDMIYCSLALVGGTFPEVLEFANLVQCLTMDINGPLNMEADIPVTGNGILDGSYELGILAALYNAGDTEVMAAYQNNFTAVKNLLQQALDAAGYLAILQAAAPYALGSLSSVLGGLCTLDDEQTNAALDQLLLLLADIGLEPPEGGIGAITTGLAYLGAEGDADNSGNSNRAEYNYFVGSLEYSAADYVAAALDSEQEPPDVLTITGPTGRVVVGDNVTISVTVNVGNWVSGQWFKGGSILEGEDGNALNLSNVQVADSGVYRVDVTVDAKATEVHSASYTLTVLEFTVPVGSALGMVMLAGACGLAGVAGLRRRK